MNSEPVAEFEECNFEVSAMTITSQCVLIFLFVFVLTSPVSSQSGKIANLYLSSSSLVLPLDHILDGIIADTSTFQKEYGDFPGRRTSIKTLFWSPNSQVLSFAVSEIRSGDYDDIWVADIAKRKTSCVTCKPRVQGSMQQMMNIWSAENTLIMLCESGIVECFPATGLERLSPWTFVHGNTIELAWWGDEIAKTQSWHPSIHILNVVDKDGALHLIFFRLKKEYVVALASHFIEGAVWSPNGEYLTVILKDKKGTARTLSVIPQSALLQRQ